MAFEVVSSSRLRFAKVLRVEGVEFWDVPEWPEFPDRPDDLRHKVQANERLDSIAYRYYGDSVLWWVIALKNDIELPQDIVEDQTLVIPSPAYVRQLLARRT